MDSSKAIIVNKKSKFDYVILEVFTAGICLSGLQVNYIRDKQINLAGKYIIYQNKKLQLIGLTVEKSTFNLDLMVTKKELGKIVSEIKLSGISLVPLSIFRQKRWMKMEIAIVKGRDKADKKQYLKEKDIKKEMKNEVL